MSEKNIDAKIKKYVEEKVFPEYEEHAGHGLAHINYVIRRSIKFAEEAPEANINMVYVAAAYHDIGRKIDNEHHEIESAKIFLNDEFMKGFFTDEERIIIAEAIEDHRASSKHEPRSIYGQIVSSANRSTSVIEILNRIYDYNRSIHPEYSEEEALADCCRALRVKYGTGGYATTKMFFHDPEYEKFILEIEEITADPAKYMKMQREHNKKRSRDIRKTEESKCQQN